LTEAVWLLPIGTMRCSVEHGRFSRVGVRAHARASVRDRASRERGRGVVRKCDIEGKKH